MTLLCDAGVTLLGETRCYLLSGVKIFKEIIIFLQVIKQINAVGRKVT